MLRSLIVVAAAVAMTACAQVERVREAAIEPGLRIYRSGACVLSPAIKDAERAGVYERTGVYLVSDCQWIAGSSTIDEFERRMLNEFTRRQIPVVE